MNAAPQNSLGIYIHIPFCRSKCAYCDFASWTGLEPQMALYVDRVIREIRLRARQDPGAVCDTVFFGGGTPSLLPQALFEKLFGALRESFVLTPDCEITCEANPGTLTRALAECWVRCGVNRISLGMQSASDRLLRLLGRIHTAEEVRQAVQTARACGLENLNLDLMLGLPGQTLEDMRDTLSFALSLQPAHVSCYALIPEEGTPLMARLSRREVTLPPEDVERHMYALCRNTLARYGFEQYEISNFALPGRLCLHNLHCWQRADYWGFGCAAASLRHEVRWQNPRDFHTYMDGAPPEREALSTDEAMFETMMLGLRLTSGVSEDAFMAKFGIPLRQVYGSKLAPALADGRLEAADGTVRLTERGMDVMNSVLVELMD